MTKQPTMDFETMFQRLQEELKTNSEKLESKLDSSNEKLENKLGRVEAVSYTHLFSNFIVVITLVARCV